MARRYEASPAYRTPGVNASKAETASQLAAVLSNFRDTVANITASRSAARGAEAGAQSTGTPTLRSTLRTSGRAYNDAALRNYAIEKYSEMERELGRLEDEAGTDPDKFATLADGARRGAIKNALPEARADIGLEYQKRISEGVIRLDVKRRDQQKAVNRAMLEEGLTTVTDAISRKISSGNPVLMAEAQEDEARFMLMVDGAINSGDLTPAEAVALKADGKKRVTKQIVSGLFENAVTSGDPVDFISRVMDQPVENLSDEEKQQTVSELFGRLNQRQALISERNQLDALELERQYAEGEKEATEALLDGRLTVGTIARMTSEDRLKPAISRTLLNELQEGADRPDDSKERFHVETNLLSISEEEIRDNKRLSWETKRELVAKRRDEAQGWKSTQQAREGADRIDRALGIVPGMDTRLLSDADRNARDRALTEWYNTVDSLPEDERQVRAIETSEAVIQRVIRTNAGNEAERLDNLLRAYKKDKDSAKLKGAALKEYTDTVSRYERQIAEARKRAQ